MAVHDIVNAGGMRHVLLIAFGALLAGGAYIQMGKTSTVLVITVYIILFPVLNDLLKRR